MRTGIQTSQPGYVAPLHSHPYTEILHVLEGRAEAWLEGGEAHPTKLGPGDTIAIPPETLHSFRVVGDTPMRLLGTHVSPRRIVNYADGRQTDARGYRVEAANSAGRRCPRGAAPPILPRSGRCRGALGALLEGAVQAGGDHVGMDVALPA